VMHPMCRAAGLTKLNAMQRQKSPKCIMQGAEPQPGALMVDTRKLLFEQPATTTGRPNSKLQRAGPSNITTSSGCTSLHRGLQIGEISTHGTHVDGDLSQSPPTPVSQPALPSANNLVNAASPAVPVPGDEGTRAPPGYPQPIFRERTRDGILESVDQGSPMPLHLLSLPFFAN
jgi:hypothetical protein